MKDIWNKWKLQGDIRPLFSISVAMLTIAYIETFSPWNGLHVAIFVKNSTYIFITQTIILAHVVKVLLSLMLPKMFIFFTEILILIITYDLLQCPFDFFLLIKL